MNLVVSIGKKVRSVLPRLPGFGLQLGKQIQAIQQNAEADAS
jgi:hypothetical protein